MFLRLCVVLWALFTCVSVKADVTLVGWWNFESNGNDLTGNFAASTSNGVSISGGRLVLNPGDPSHYLRTGAYSGPAITEKTLVSWVKLNDLSGAGSSALTLETTGGNTFDGIVYAERTVNQWMAGSNNWLRTPGNNGGATEISTALLQLAIVYKADNSITLYRNAVLYGTSYTQGSLITYSGSSIDAIFGWRHTTGGGGTISAEIEDARIYSGVLTSTDLAALVPNVIPEPAGVAMLTLSALFLVRRPRR